MEVCYKAKCILPKHFSIKVYSAQTRLDIRRGPLPDPTSISSCFIVLSADFMVIDTKSYSWEHVHCIAFQSYPIFKYLKCLWKNQFLETQNMTKFLLFTFFWFLMILHGFALISLTQKKPCKIMRNQIKVNNPKIWLFFLVLWDILWFWTPVREKVLWDCLRYY